MSDTITSMTRWLLQLFDALLAIVVVLWCTGSVYAQSPEIFAGRQLEDALRVLQAQGLRLVFSSELVTPEMRVRTEPRAKAARQRLIELLEPHGLAAENGPGSIVQIVRRKRSIQARPSSVLPAAQPKKTNPDDLSVSAAQLVYRERVTVTAHAREREDAGGSGARQLASNELNAFSSHIADDPLRVVQTMPGAAAGDDFRSEYSVRGSKYRHAAVVIDGVIAPWLQHAALGRGDAGTMTMLRGDLVQEAALLVGAYARVDGSQVGPQLNLTLREGSRTVRRFRVGVSGMSTTFTAEGPIGSPARGSWLVGVRQSHREWPVSRSDEDSTVFGFSDVQSKVVYDVHPGQEISLSLVAGLSNVEREDPNPFALADGLNRAAMATLAWRSIIGTHTTITQRVSSLVHDFRNRNQTARMASHGTNDAYAYRVDLGQSIVGGALEAGGQVRRMGGSRFGPTAHREVSPVFLEPAIFEDVDRSWYERSVHTTFRRAIAPSVTIASGLRVADSTLMHRRALDRWLQVEWSVAPRWRVHGSTGVTHQFPAVEEVAGWPEPASLGPEQATHVDLGIGHNLTPSIRWDATAFLRRERDVLREPDVHPRLIDGVLDVRRNAARFENALTGAARGVELTLARRAQNSLSGWVSYSYGVARYTDAARQEAFPSDFDQRHAITLSGSTSLPKKARLGLTFRGGTNFPIPGYFVGHNGRLFAGSERNQERFPPYARLDVRAERSFTHARRQITVFAETLNVLNRVNRGPTDGVLVRETGQAVGFTEPLLPRLLTAGLRYEF